MGLGGGSWKWGVDPGLERRSVDFQRSPRIERARVERPGPLLRREPRELEQRGFRHTRIRQARRDLAGDCEIFEAAGERLGRVTVARAAPGRSEERRIAIAGDQAVPADRKSVV